MSTSAEWFIFIVEVYGHTLTHDKVERARNLHENAVVSLRSAQQDLAVWPPRDWLHQKALTDARASKALIEEIEHYVRTKKYQGIADRYEKRNHPFYRAFSHSSHASFVLSSVYRLAEYVFTHRSHPPLEERRNTLLRRGFSPEAITDILSGDEEKREIYSIYVALDSLEASEELRELKAEAARAKKALPQPFHRLVDMYVQMFWDEPREIALQYIRRNYPGPIGAFYGLPESVGFKRPLK